jgi:hypothetical protein
MLNVDVYTILQYTYSIYYILYTIHYLVFSTIRLYTIHIMNTSYMILGITIYLYILYN